MGNRNSTQVDLSFYKRPAYQIVHIVKDSPADKAGLLPYFDFITYLPPVLTYDYRQSYDEFVNQRYHNSHIDLNVFNSATGCLRKVSIYPSTYNNGPDLTGFIFRNVVINDAIAQVEHVQEVIIGSPAFNVGLVPYFDYIIATDNGDCQDLHKLIKPHNPNEFLRIFVVDILARSSRIVHINGLTKLGECRFGCTLASGYLHRIPICQLDFWVVKRQSTPIFPLTAETTSCECGAQKSNKNKLANILKEQLGKNDSEQTSQQAHTANQTNHCAGGDQLDHCALDSKLHNSNNANLTNENKTTKSCINDAETKPNVRNYCTFVTAVNVPGPIEHKVLPISVQIPKDIVENVLVDLVRYNVEQKQKSVEQNTDDSTEAVDNGRERNDTNDDSIDLCLQKSLIHNEK